MKGASKYILSTIIFVLCLAFHSLAQSAEYSYNLKIEKPLVQVIDDLSNNYALEFSYPSEIIDKYQIQKAHFNSTSLFDLINSILVSTDLEFQIIDRRKILLRPKRIGHIENYTSTMPKRIVIRGDVKDENGAPVSYVDVVLDTLFLGASTDEYGHFEFDIPRDLEDRNISFHLIGYDVKTRLVSSIQESPITNLSSAALDLEEVVFIEKIPSIEINPITLKSTIQSDYLNNLITPILSNDILRGVQMMAGVSATNDASAEIRIRGSQGDETLIMLDGIPIYKADHYYGIFGSVNGNHINEISLYKNNIPIEYGGKTGGMLEMKSKDYISKSEGILDLNMLTSSLTYRTPINDKWSLQASGRTTYDNAADSKIFNWVEPSPEENLVDNLIESSDRPLVLKTSPIIQFYDLNAKLLFRPSTNHQFSINMFNGNDKYSNQYDIGFERQLVVNTATGQELFDDQESWNNLGASLNYKGEINTNANINVSLYNSKYEYSGALLASTSFNVNNINRFVALNNQKRNSISDLGGTVVYSKKWDSEKLSIGLSGKEHNIDFYFETDDVVLFDDKLNAFEGSIFGDYAKEITNQFSINVGSRINYYSETDKLYWSPRINANYNTSDKISLKAAFSKNYQFVREVTNYTRLREPIEIFLLTTDEKRTNQYPVGTSTNFMIGSTIVHNKWALDAELYYKDLGGVVNQTQIVYSRDSNDDFKPSNRLPRILTGVGRSIGMDLSVGYEGKSYSGWLVYTLSSTTNRFNGIAKDEWFPSQDDRRHQLKLVNQYTIGNWSLMGNYIYGSGRNYLDLTAIANDNGEVDLTNRGRDNFYSELSPYHRVDLGMYYSIPVGKNEGTIGLQILNALNSENVDYIQYLFSTPRLRNNMTQSTITGTTTQLLDRTFNLSFKFEW